MISRAGVYVNNLSGDAEYKSFCPSCLPPSPPIKMDEEMVDSLMETSRLIAFLEGMTSQIPDLNLFISMYVRKEALLSSQIEGTQCTLEDVFNPFLQENANRDVSDVINYVKAVSFALDERQRLPLCNRLIREIHAVLMKGVRGGDKSPGDFRVSQNWIGPAGGSLKNAGYIPPNPDDMAAAMAELEEYINSDDSLNPLIQAALIHYQFETIHPFLDGNGRMGRLLIILFLMEKKVISTPCLSVSFFFKIYRSEYYERMSRVRRTGDYEQWIKFFLRALGEAAEDAINTVNCLRSLHNENLKVIKCLDKRQNDTLEKLFAYLEANPIIEISNTKDALSLSYNTVAKAVKLLLDKGIISETGKRGKARIYSYTAYLDILGRNTQPLI